MLLSLSNPVLGGGEPLVVIGWRGGGCDIGLVRVVRGVLGGFVGLWRRAPG